MNLSGRLFALVATLSTVLATIATACPETTEDLGIDFWHISALEEELFQGEQLQAELEHECQEARRRIETRESVVGDVIEGRQTLEEAANIFANLNTGRTDVGEFALVRFPDRTPQEVAALQVIQQVKHAKHPRAKAVAAALEAEVARSRPVSP